MCKNDEIKKAEIKLIDAAIDFYHKRNNVNYAWADKDISTRHLDWERDKLDEAEENFFDSVENYVKTKEMEDE